MAIINFLISYAIGTALGVFIVIFMGGLYLAIRMLCSYIWLVVTEWVDRWMTERIEGGDA